MHDVSNLNADNTAALIAASLDFDVIFRDGNFEVLCFLENGVANFLFGLGAVGAHLRFRLDRILKLIIREVRRDQSGAEVDDRHNSDYAKDHFHGTHNAAMLASGFGRSRAWKRLQRIFGNWQVTGSQKSRSSSYGRPFRIDHPAQRRISVIQRKSHYSFGLTIGW